MRCFVSVLRQLSSANISTQLPPQSNNSLLFDNGPTLWAKPWFGALASEIQANIAGLSLSLSNHNNWRRLCPEISICY
jgi:hypothetical protein